LAQRLNITLVVSDGRSRSTKLNVAL
jgi:hypothetical protein